MSVKTKINVLRSSVNDLFSDEGALVPDNDADSVDVLEVEVDEPGILVDIDTREDYINATKPNL